MPGAEPLVPTVGAAAVLRSLALPIYVPAVVVQTGTAMLLLMLPLYLRDIDLSYSRVSVVLVAAGIGAMLTQIPFGQVLGRRSETSVMAASVLLMGLTTGLFGWLEVTALLVGLQLCWGAGSTGWLLSRQTLMTRAAPPSVRGRAMSLFGGTTRLSFFVGPVVGGLLVDRFGFRSGFMIAAAVTLAGLFPLLMGRRREPAGPALPTTTTVERPMRTVVEHWRILLPVGSAQVLIIAVRQGRNLVIPLIGDSLGLDPGDVGLLVGIGTFTDFALFPLAGYTMDRFGRLAAIVPAFSLVGIGLVWLSTVDSYVGVAGAVALIGVGNSFGSGTMLTLSGDVAPTEATSQFLGVLGMIRDGGRILGPIVVGAMADAVGLGAAALTLGIGSFVAVAIFVFAVGETAEHVTARSTC